MLARLVFGFSFWSLTEESRLHWFSLSNTDCELCAEPQEFAFPVHLRTPETEVSLTRIPLRNIKLYKKFTGQCPNDQVWRSRVTCLGIVYTLMGAVLLLISLRVRCEEEVISPYFLQDMKWVLQTRCRSWWFCFHVYFMRTVQKQAQGRWAFTFCTWWRHPTIFKKKKKKKHPWKTTCLLGWSLNFDRSSICPEFRQNPIYFCTFHFGSTSYVCLVRISRKSTLGKIKRTNIFCEIYVIQAFQQTLPQRVHVHPIHWICLRRTYFLFIYQHAPKSPRYQEENKH